MYRGMRENTSSLLDSIEEPSVCQQNEQEVKITQEVKINPPTSCFSEEEQKTINPYNFNNKLLKKNDIENLLKQFNVYQNINDLDLYQRAFTHDSYSKPKIEETIEKDQVELVDKPEGAIPLQDQSYQRLEFLGDRVVNLIVALYLFIRYPKQDQGFLSTIYSKIVDRKGLSRLAKSLNFGENLLVSRHAEEKNNAREEEANLEDSFEAFTGALFYDFLIQPEINADITSPNFDIGPGFRNCVKFLINLIQDEDKGVDFVELINHNRNYKNMINTYFQQEVGYHPEYVTDQTSLGPNSKQRIFWISVQDKTGKVYGKAVGRGKKKYVQQKAARNALVEMGMIPDDDEDDFFNDTLLDKELEDLKILDANQEVEDSGSEEEEL